MTKKDYYEQVTSIVKQTVAELSYLQTDIDELQGKIEDNHRFAKEYIKQTLIPSQKELVRKQEETKKKAIAEIQGITNNIIAEYKALDELKPEEITDDAKLLNVGIKLSADDLQLLFDRNKDNNTMMRLISNYARDNEIDMKRNYFPVHADDMSNAAVVPHYCETTFRFFNNDSVYDKLLGENSETFHRFND